MSTITSLLQISDLQKKIVLVGIRTWIPFPSKSRDTKHLHTSAKQNICKAGLLTV